MYFAGYLGSAQIEKYYKDITTELARTFDIENLSKRVPAHITLRYPFEIESYSDIQNKIIQLLPRQKTQHLFIDGFGHFGDETIYLNVKVDNHEMFIKKYVRGLGNMENFKMTDLPCTCPLQEALAVRRLRRRGFI